MAPFTLTPNIFLQPLVGEQARYQLRALRRNGLEFKAGLSSRKVERFDRIGIVDLPISREFVEAWQTNNRVPKFGGHNFSPNTVRNVKIKLVVALTDTASLPLTITPIVVCVPIRHCHTSSFMSLRFCLMEQRPYQ
jgi:hypothetical protein